MGDKFASKINVVKSGDLKRPERPDEYAGEVSIYDPNAKIETVGGYVTLVSHGKKIDIEPTADKK